MWSELHLHATGIARCRQLGCGHRCWFPPPALAADLGLMTRNRVAGQSVVLFPEMHALISVAC